MRPALRHLPVLIPALAIALWGCSGVVGGGPTGAGAAGTNGSGAAGNGVAGAAGAGAGVVTGTAGDGALATCPTTAATPTPLRRLTKFEYANTARNLLGVDTTPVNDLPADEVTEGFNNNAGVLTVSSLHAEKYVLVSEALAKAAVKNLSTLTGGCNTTTKGEDACATEFANSFGRRAFRRAVTDQDRQMLMAAYTAGKTGGSYAEGIEVMVRAALQSAHFLYRLETTAPANPSAPLVPISQYELATRLSFLIWAAGPDDALLDAAGRGELADKAAVATKARAMLADPKARVAITDFYNQWLGTSRLDIMTKSTSLFPQYSDAVRDAMKAETPAFVEYVLWSGDHKLSTLLTSPTAFVSSALAPIYGVSTTSATPQMMSLPAAQARAGILTQASFLAVQAHPDQTSPVLRGKFVRSKLMCQPPPPPPMDVNITLPPVSAGGTARQRLSGHLTAGTSCMNCHVLMDPIGLTFENFDSIGQYRTKEGDYDIDVAGEINAPRDAGLGGKFSGVRELAVKLAASGQVRDCLAELWFDFAVGRRQDAADGCSLSTLQGTFASSGGNLVDLIVGMTQTDAFWYRAPYTQ